MDANGTANPPEVIFSYALNATPVPNALVTVRYVDQATGAELIAATQQEIPAGQTVPVYAQPIEGYTATANEQAISVDANGTANPPEVIFTYTMNAAAPEAIQEPQLPPTDPNNLMFVEAPIEVPADVYTGPGAHYFRAAESSARIESGVVRWYGTENGWAMMGYQYGEDAYRIGYVDATLVPAGISLPPLAFTYEPIATVGDAFITDDPILSQVEPRWLTTLPPGTPVTLLGFLPDTQWAYVETQLDGLPVRGFTSRESIGR